MSRRLASDREGFGRRWICRQAAGGLTVGEWCRQSGVSAASFLGQLDGFAGKIQREARGATAGVEFLHTDGPVTIDAKITAQLHFSR